jgi:ABC-type dipeptide/oligopeptide/nickel transport system permease subunit
MLALPGIILILAVLAVFAHSMSAAMVTLGVLVSRGLARVVRSAVLPIKEDLFIAAAGSPASPTATSSPATSCRASAARSSSRRL